MAASLYDGDYREAMRLGIAHNGEVMKARGGAPGVVEEDGRLRVRLREEGQTFRAQAAFRRSGTTNPNMR